MGPDRPERLTGDLVALAELELELVLAGRADELAGIQERRDAVIARLPPELPPASQTELRLALGLQRRAAVVLAGALAEHGRELAGVGRGRTAARGYAPAGLGPRRVLDRSA